jgi:hypothetical protein
LDKSHIIAHFNLYLDYTVSGLLGSGVHILGESWALKETKDGEMSGKVRVRLEFCGVLNQGPRKLSETKASVTPL